MEEARAQAADSGTGAEAPVLVVPLGAVDDGVIEAATRALKERYRIGASVAAARELPTSCFVAARKQYDSRCLVESLRGALPDEGRGFVLGLTGVDIFAAGMGFVFGQAELGGRVALVSTARLVDDRPGVPAGTLTPIFERRVRTEVVHEVGHLLGLDHCANPYCAMAFSRNLLDTDRKGDDLCFLCRSRLGLPAPSP